MDRDKDSLFSNGLNLANLAVSSNLVQDSWDAISKLKWRINQPFPLRFIRGVFRLLDPATVRSDGNNRVIIKEFRHQNYNIIALVTSPVSTGHCEGERALVPLKISDFQFLSSKRNPTLHGKGAAISLFNSILDKLSQLKKKVVTSAKSKDPVPYVITGLGLGGSVASLFTLWLLYTLEPIWLLNTLEPTKGIPLCITFGSPLIGVSAFQEAVTQYSAWNSCFLHVVHKDDSFPRLSICPPIHNRSTYKPFGTFLLCSELGGACFEAPESIMELLPSKASDGNEERRRVDYKNVIRCLERRLTHRDRSGLNGQEVDTYKAGVTTQVRAVGLTPIQQQRRGTDALIEDTLKHERGVIRQRKEPFYPDEDFKEMEVYLAKLERYMKVCRADGQAPGYYDSFKNARDGEVDECKTILTDYWERVVKDAEKKRQLWSTLPRNHWLIAGTKYRRIVEPLDIAEYYKKGRKDYKKGGRSKHYELLEKWPEDHQKKNSQEKNGRSNLRLKNIESKRKYRRIFKPLDIGEYHKIGRKAYEKGGRFKHHGLLEKWQEDHKKKNSREQAGPSNLKLIDIESRVTEDSCFWAHVEEAIQFLDSGELSNEFEEYVMRLINNCAVSPDIFLEKSSYMQWWREYEKILEQRMIGHSHESQSDLVRFMRNDPRKNYIQRSLRGNDKGAIWSVLSASLSWPFFLILPLFLLLSKGKKLGVNMDWVSGSHSEIGSCSLRTNAEILELATEPALPLHTSKKDTSQSVEGLH